MSEPAATTARLDDIAAAAARLFVDKGYDAASMADLAAATGLGKSSLYHHLSSKDQLLDHICLRRLDALKHELAEAATLSASAGARVAVALGELTRIALEDVPASHLILTIKPTSDAARRILAERREVERALTELVAAAQEQGAVRTDVEAPLLTRLVISTINGLVTWYRPETAEVDPSSVRDAVLALMLSAVQLEVVAQP